MTYEHAEQTVQKLSDEGVRNFCQAACLDGILQYADVDETHYRNLSQAFSDGDDDRFGHGVESMIRPIFPEGVFKTHDHEHRFYPYKINPGNPLTNRPEDIWSMPRPEHKRLLRQITVSEEDGAWTHRDTENRMGLYVVLDNVFKDGLTVMIDEQKNGDSAHVCGLQQVGPDEFYLVDTGILDDGSAAMYRYGPSTLLEMCGFEDPSRPASWPKSETDIRANHLWVEAQDGTRQYSLRIFPTEPRPQVARACKI
jgi:hypothetical protein